MMRFNLSRFICVTAIGATTLFGSIAIAEVKIATPDVLATDSQPTNMLHVTGDGVEGPVRFEGMQLVPPGSQGEFIFDTGDGVVKKIDVNPPALVFYAQSTVKQDYNQPAFGSGSLTFSNQDVLQWYRDPTGGTDDVVLEAANYIELEPTTSPDDQDTFLVKADGKYKITGHANYYLSDGLVMQDETHISVVVYRLEPGATTWKATVGNRCPFSSEWESLTSSCVYNGVATLTAGTKLRVQIFRGNGYVFSAPHPGQILTSAFANNGVTATRSIEIIFFPNN